MTLSELCIRRPVMTTLITASIIAFGVFGFRLLPVSALPRVDFPTIAVTATLPGASADTMAASVAGIIERQLSTIAGISSMSSSSSQGTSVITIQFDLNRSIDAAALDVQTALTIAQRRLPIEMTIPPSFRKVNPADFPVLFVSLGSATLPLSAVNEYGDITIGQALSQLPGVAQVLIYGAQKFAIRVQADPEAAAARGLSLEDIRAAVSRANSSTPVGTLNGPKQDVALQASGQMDKAADYSRVVVAWRNGSPVKLDEVAKIYDSVENDKIATWLNGDRAIVIAIQKQPDANTVAVVDAVRAKLPALRAQIPPSVSMNVMLDRSISVRQSVTDVEETLAIAVVLVILVIFLFLRSASATFIPALAVPISLFGTCAAMYVLDYSINNMTLLALTLSVGFVVDDAIVMLENIVRHIEKGEKPFEAAMKGSSEIGFTILSMTISLAAVFIPIVFMGGIVGRLLHEFAVTIILAILFSGVISITLTPMLCARILKDEHGQQHNWFYRLSENTFNQVQAFYDRTLRWSITHPRAIIGLFFASLAASVLMVAVMQQDFLPSDDTGRIQGSIQAANGTSYTQMAAYTTQVMKIVGDDPDIEGVMGQMEGANGSAGTNQARLFMIKLKPLSIRKSTPEQIIRRLRPKVSRIAGVNVFLTNPPAIRLGARQARSTYQYTLQGLDLGQLQDYSDRLMDALRKQSGFVDITSDNEAAMPSVQVKINRDRAAAFGVTPMQIETALGSAFGGQRISQIDTSANQYDVIMELLPR